MSDDIFLAASVTRHELGLDPLNINDEQNYVLGRGLAISTITWRKDYVTSPFMDGRVVVHEAKDAAEATVVVYVMGSTSAELNTNLGTLLEAFSEQYRYQLSITADEIVYEWLCERADYEVGFITETLAARYIPVTFSLFRHPVPLQGVM